MDLMHTSNVIYEAFLKSHLITLGHLVDVAGSNLQDCRNV